MRLTRRGRSALWCAGAGAAILLAVAATSAWAQASPFGVHAAASGATGQGVVGWVLSEQAAIYRSLSKLVRDSRVDGAAFWLLAGFSFLYGVLHAAGPGHGKAVISSYLVANDETWKRGIVLSGLSSLLQALVAIAIVGIGAGLLQVTAQTMGSAVRIVEIAAYGLIIAIGVRLLWRSGPAFVRALRHFAHRRHGVVAVAGSGERRVALAFDEACCSYHARLQARGGSKPQRSSTGEAKGAFACTDAADAGAGADWRDGLSAVVATGIRPCSGAILILVFAFSLQLYWTGVISALLMGVGTAVTVAAFATATVFMRDVAIRYAGFRSDIGSVIVSGIGVAAALFVTAFGALLLAGYIASERIGALG